MKSFVSMILCMLMTGLAFAQTPSKLDDVRAREIGKSLRCVVCQNQSIEESDSELAMDMRKLVRQRIAQGDSDTEIRQYMRVRYGDYILMQPPVQMSTWLLWGGPILALLAFVWVFFRMTTRTRRRA